MERPIRIVECYTAKRYKIGVPFPHDSFGVVGCCDQSYGHGWQVRPVPHRTRQSHLIPRSDRKNTAFKAS